MSPFTDLQRLLGKKNLKKTDCKKASLSQGLHKAEKLPDAGTNYYFRGEKKYLTSNCQTEKKLYLQCIV